MDEKVSAQCTHIHRPRALSHPCEPLSRQPEWFHETFIRRVPLDMLPEEQQQVIMVSGGSRHSNGRDSEAGGEGEESHRESNPDGFQSQWWTRMSLGTIRSSGAGQKTGSRGSGSGSKGDGGAGRAGGSLGDFLAGGLGTFNLGTVRKGGREGQATPSPRGSGIAGGKGPRVSFQKVEPVVNNND